MKKANRFSLWIWIAGLSLTLVNGAGSARAEEGKPASAAKLELGESFLFAEPMAIEQGHIDHIQSSDGPDTLPCYNTRTIRTYLVQDFLKMDMGTREVVANDRNFDKSLRSFNFFSRNDYRCTWKEPLVAEELAERMKPYTEANSLRLVLLQMSPAGTAIIANSVLTNDHFARTHLTNGESKLVIPTQLTLAQCSDTRGAQYTAEQLGQPGSAKKLDQASRAGSVEALITALRDQAYLELQYCRFSVSRTNMPREFVRDLTNFGSFEESVLTVVRGDPNRLISSRLERGWSSNKESPFRGNYVRENVTDNPGAEQVALAAGREFVEFIQMEYGGLLYSLVERNTPEVERREAIRAFFENNRARIEGWFRLMDQNYAAVSLMNKISLLGSLSAIYAKVDAIEKSVVKVPVQTLDRVVKRYAK